MIMKCKITRLLSLFVVMFTMFSTSALAGGSTYYSKVVATAVGEGKVYASKSSTNNPSYKEGSSEAKNSTSTSTALSTAPTHTYYVYAQANDGSEFVGWFDNAQCSGEPVSKTTAYTVKFTANSTEENNPTVQNLYAKFQKKGAPSLVYGNDHVYVNLSVGTYKNETLTTENVTETITYESSNTNVAIVASDGTVTLKKNGSCYIKAKSGEGEGSYILTVIDDAAAGVTQIGNGDFENWSSVTSDNHAPNNWNSFETAEGGLASTASAVQVAIVEGGRPESDGLYCADIWSRSVFGVVAQGNLTTGCVNAGAMSASDNGNYNYSKAIDPNTNKPDPQKSETLSKVPSALKLWVKFVPAAVNAQHPNAHVQAIVHGNGNYRTYSNADNGDQEYENNKKLAIAEAVYDFPSTNGEWVELKIPFVPTGNTTNGQMYILVNISTNADPGEGQAGDHLYIDDIELVYPDPTAPETVVYNDKYIGISVNGAQNAPVAAPIEVTDNKNGTIDFNLKNFILDDGSTTINVGNITLSGLTIDDQGNFSYDGNINITAGDKEGVNTWAGPLLGPIPVVLNGTIKGNYFYVHINISMANQDVVVEVGDKADATVNVTNALISTFCAPFNVGIPANYQSYVTVSKVTGAANNGVLTLEAIEGGVIPANTPVVVEIPQAMELPVSGIYVKGTETPTVGLLTGVYKETNAPEGSYVLQNINGKVGFYKVFENKQPKVKANHAYLTKSGSNNVKAFYFNEDDATVINNINVNANEGTIYNVAGQRLNKMQKGINIINGKKILK